MMDVSSLGLGCNFAPITGSRSVAGTFIANADGTYVDRTTTSGEDQIVLPPACLNVSGTVVRCDRLGPVLSSMGYDTVACLPAADGGCLCDAVFSHGSGLGVVTWESSQSGSFTTSGSTLTLNDGLNEPRSYRYCSSTGQLELLPLSTYTSTLEGAVVLAEP